MSDLIRQQVETLARIEQDLPAELRTGVDVKTLTTEHHAGAYIAHATSRLLDHAKTIHPAPKPKRRRATKPSPTRRRKAVKPRGKHPRRAVRSKGR